MEKSGKQASEIDFILVATVTPDFNMPSVACPQGAIGATEAFAFDISAACSGFVYALSMAEKLVLSGRYQTGLVVAKHFPKCWIGPIAPQRCFSVMGLPA